MATKFSVPLHGRPMGKVDVEDGSTKGATVGLNLYKADGTVVQLAEILNVPVVPGDTLNAVGVTPGTFGSATDVPVVTVDVYGRITSVTLAAISFPAAPVTSVFGRTGAVTAQAGDYSFGQLSGTPTTLLGYGITDAAPSSHVGAGGAAHANVVASGAAGFMTGTDKTKLDGIAAGATVNSTDAALRDRSTHTGTQTISTISDAVPNTYTPTFTNVTNVASSVAFANTIYFKFGLFVAVWGRFTSTATAAAPTLTQLDISLPVASNLGAAEDLCGHGTVTYTTGHAACRIQADAVNNRAAMTWHALTTAAANGTFHFCYRELP